MLPEIHIHYSAYLDEIFRGWISTVPKYKDWKPPVISAVMHKTAAFKGLWEERGRDILEQMVKLTGLNFKRNYFPIYVVAGNPRAYSNPIVVKSGFSVEEFLISITHELIHCLFVDNKDSIFIENNDRLFTNDHITLYAVLGLILPHVLRIDLNVDVFPLNKKYAEAIAFVNQRGALSIIEECKKY